MYLFITSWQLPLKMSAAIGTRTHTMVHIIQLKIKAKSDHKQLEFALITTNREAKFDISWVRAELITLPTQPNHGRGLLLHQDSNYWPLIIVYILVETTHTWVTWGIEFQDIMLLTQPQNYRHFISSHYTGTHLYIVFTPVKSYYYGTSFPVWNPRNLYFLKHPPTHCSKRAV